MKADIKARWVAALRSGEYVQGTGALHKRPGPDDLLDGEVATSSFCCLGVLCALHAAETGAQWPSNRGSVHQYYLGAAGLSPAVVNEWAGLLFRSVDIGVHRATLAEHNDSGKTFAQIADAIEEQL